MKDQEENHSEAISELEGILKKTQVAGDSSQQSTGIKAFLDRALQTYEKLPMLEIVFDRFIRILSNSMRNLSTENIELSINSFRSMRFDDYMQNLPSGSLLAVFKAIEWENLGLLTIQSSLIFSMVDVLFGGKKVSINTKFEERGYTDIEQALAKQIIEIILKDLAGAFSPTSAVNLQFDRVETNPNFASIVRPGEAIILFKLNIMIGEDNKSTIDIVLPYSTIEPIKPLLTQVFMGETFGINSEWEESLRNSAHSFEMIVKAVIENKPTKMQNVMNLKVGHTIIMDQLSSQPVKIKCENIDLFKGYIGKIDNKIALSVAEVLIKEDNEENVEG